MCVFAAVNVQKRQLREQNLRKSGGAVAFVDKLKASASWSATDVETEKLAGLADFLVSEDGLDFHSDEDTHAAMQPEQGAASSAETQPVVYIYEQRVVLRHTFRSQLAADIAHALNLGIACGVPSSEFGAELSVRMATRLQQRPDLRALIDEDKVNAVAAKKAPNKRHNDDVHETVQPPAKRQQVSLHACAQQCSGSAVADIDAHASLPDLLCVYVRVLCRTTA